MKMPENKVIITAALTGGSVTKKMNPALPEQPDEIARAAYDCYNEGAAIAHIHARNPDGSVSGDTAIFGDIHQKIKAKCKVIIQDSTCGGIGLTLEQRSGCLEALPEMASLNMGTMVRTAVDGSPSLYINTRPDIEGFVKRMNQFGVKPEMEIYNPSMFREVRNLIEKGLIIKPYCLNLIVGIAYQGAMDANHLHLLTYIQNMPEDSYFNTLGAGSIQTTLCTLGMILGGNVRVGLEDNIYYREGELAKSNAQLVARIVRIARELGKEPATPEEARTILGLEQL
jgi:3-keto-5-aminohexanoate cleavage enzyme